MRFAPAFVLFAVLAAPACAEEAQGITEAEGKARATHLAAVIEKWESDTGLQVVYDLAGFWKKMGPKATFQSMAIYIKFEDGVKEPLRTGREVALYNRIKKFVETRKKEETLGMDDLLVFGLESVEPVEETVNFQEVILTLHNVIRLLARPQQWAGAGNVEDFGHPDTDPAFPIMQDLRGTVSTRGRTLADTCGIKKKPDGEVVDPMWSLPVLFEPKSGAFQLQPGARETLWNGGCHYYYWVGALGHATLGSVAVMGGLFAELRAKKSMGDGDQGVVQVSSYTAGSMFGAEAFARRDGLLGWFDGRWKGEMSMKWDGKPVQAPLALQISTVEGGFRIANLDPATLEPVANKDMEATKFTVRKEGPEDDPTLFIEASSDKEVLTFRLKKPGTLEMEGWQKGRPGDKATGTLKRIGKGK